LLTTVVAIRLSTTLQDCKFIVRRVQENAFHVLAFLTFNSHMPCSNKTNYSLAMFGIKKFSEVLKVKLRQCKLIFLPAVICNHFNCKINSKF